MLRKPSLTMPRILVAEDNFLMAEVVCDFVRSCGLWPVGPASTVERGVELARSEDLDGAVLDVNLQGSMCFPICSVLARRNIPFVFLTGYAGIPMVPSEFRTRRYLEKPFQPDEFEAVLLDMVGHRVRPTSATTAVARAAH